MDEADMRMRFAVARIARLATVRPDGRPHVVPVCFALVGDTVVTAVDAKPKSTAALARLDNVRAHPHASLLVDHYDDDWSRLWWIRADGTARVDGMTQSYRDALTSKYQQYSRVELLGPVIVVGDVRFTAWASSRPTPA